MGVVPKGWLSGAAPYTATQVLKDIEEHKANMPIVKGAFAELLASQIKAFQKDIDDHIFQKNVSLFSRSHAPKDNILHLIDLGEGMLIPKGMAEALDIISIPVSPYLTDNSEWYFSDELVKDDFIHYKHQISFAKWDKLIAAAYDPKFKIITSIP